ncbi:hypothetical protein [Mesoaciditoga lauensis]|uniref:hypothetical protein n=1 Tax=Mesoaciditoga lauensis TaxID=1495039 RepID=UPI000563C884|nr:hypothetical protein [Mesoaciditoga lauensis]
MDGVTAVLGSYLKFLEEKMLSVHDLEAKKELVKESMDVRKLLKMWEFRDYYKIDEEKWRKDHKKGEQK